MNATNLDPNALLLTILGSTWGKRVVWFLAQWVIVGSIVDAAWRAIPEKRRREWERRWPPLVGVLRVVMAGAVIRQVALTVLYQFVRRQPKWREDGRPTTAPPPPPVPVVHPTDPGNSGR